MNKKKGKRLAIVVQGGTRTRAMRENLEKMKYPTPYEMLRRLKQSRFFKIYACSPSMGMFGIKKEDLIPEVEEIVGAATFLEIAAEADVTLFI